MFSGMYSTAKAMQFAEQRHEVSANNLAHINNPGHRREVLAHREFDSYLKRQSPQAPNLNSSPYHALSTDFTSGAFKQTGRTLDVAIEGEGFLAVQGPEGTLYTKNGVMHVSEEGQIVTAENLPILGLNGPLQLPPDTSSESILITTDGRVFADSTEVGQLQVAVPASVNDLRRVGETLYAADADAEIETVEGNVRQGFLETSNVTPVNELVNLMVASRHYEAAQRTLTAISDTLQQRIDLG